MPIRCCTGASLDGKPVKSVGEMPWPEQLPDRGVLKFTFQSNFEYCSIVPVPSERELTGLLKELSERYGIAQ